MIIRKKKYEKLNDDLVDAKAKVDDAKKSLDDENKIMRATILIKDQRDQYKAERDTLIDDLSWYKAKVSRLELDNNNLKHSVNDYKGYAESHVANYLEMRALERDNENLRSRLDEFLEHDYDNQKLHKENRNLLSEISQHIGNKPSSSTYKYFRGKLNALEIREDE